MNSNLHSFPITDVDFIQEVINSPPQWINNIKPLIPRSKTVTENKLSDCHVDVDHFLPKPRFDDRIVPKTLVCHDYKGGYLEDKYHHSETADVLGNSYTFYNWSQIDYFVYFSHHLITIPPLCWINAGHKNGVKVLGTFITEFKNGEKICKEIFKDMETMQNFARNLVNLTKVFQFDGWLLNIENPVENIEILKNFVSFLTYCVHEDNPENIVIWYDSVTINGKLEWQNELNSLNEYFFNTCDGIFLNYVWNETKLMNTVEMAQHRNFDVFVGVDVFGRNTFGGGNFYCYKAAEMIRKYNLSIALFAPGWTHETLPHSEIKERYNMFINKDTLFWKSLYPYLYTHPISAFFTTKFHTGLDNENYNIFKQQHQLTILPNSENRELLPTNTEIMPLNNSCKCIQTEVINNQKCYLISRKYLKTHIKYIHNIISCDLSIDGTTLVYFLTKTPEADPNSAISLHLLTSRKSGSFRRIILLGRQKFLYINNNSVLEVNKSSNMELARDIERKFPRFREENLDLHVYTFTTSECQILEIGVQFEAGSSIYLCGFGIEYRRDLFTPFLFQK